MQDDNDSNDGKTTTTTAAKTAKPAATTSTSARRAIPLSEIQPNTHRYMQTYIHSTYVRSPYTPSSFGVYVYTLCAGETGLFSLTHIRSGSVFRWIFHFVCPVIAAAVGAVARDCCLLRPFSRCEY